MQKLFTLLLIALPISLFGQKTNPASAEKPAAKTPSASPATKPSTPAPVAGNTAFKKDTAILNLCSKNPPVSSGSNISRAALTMPRWWILHWVSTDKIAGATSPYAKSRIALSTHPVHSILQDFRSKNEIWFVGTTGRLSGVYRNRKFGSRMGKCRQLTWQPFGGRRSGARTNSCTQLF
jgi:hypothetical protein